MLKHFNDWFRRAHIPSNSGLPGRGADLYDSDPTHYEGWRELRDLQSDPNPGWNDEQLANERVSRALAYQLSTHLLDEALSAAGGVEHAVNCFYEAIERTQQYGTKHKLRAKPGVPTGFNNDSAIEAWYQFANVLIWSRTFIERLDRASLPGSDVTQRQGLLPALRSGTTKDEIGRLVSELKAGPVGASRHITNFALHTALIQHPFSGVAVDELGKIHLNVPDELSGPVSHWYLLHWGNGQDGVELVALLWKSVLSCVDGVLDAFEKRPNP